MARLSLPALLLALAVVPAPLAAQGLVQPIPGTTDADRLAAQMRLLASNPNDLSTLLAAGELALKLDDLGAAASFFARADKVDPRNGRAKAGEASILVHAERPGEALRYFALAESYGLAPAAFAADRGLAFDLIGEGERAQRDYRLALRTTPDEETQRRYALSLAITGKRELADQQLQPLLRKSDRGAWRVHAFVLAMMGNVAEASRIATTMMPPGTAAGLQPFLERLPTLAPVDRAFAVHFGEVRPTPQRIADARLVPTLPALGADPYAPRLASAVAQAPAADKGKRRGKDRKREAVQVAVATPAPVPLPQAPGYRATAGAAPVTVAARGTAPAAWPATAPVVQPLPPRPAVTLAARQATPVTPIAPRSVPAAQPTATLSTSQATPVAQPAPRSAPATAPQRTTLAALPQVDSTNAWVTPLRPGRAAVPASPLMTATAPVVQPRSAPPAETDVVVAATSQPPLVAITRPVAAPVPAPVVVSETALVLAAPVARQTTPLPPGSAAVIATTSALAATPADRVEPGFSPASQAPAVEIAAASPALAPPLAAPNRPERGEGAVSRIVASLPIPASELGIAAPARPVAAPAATPDTDDRAAARAAEAAAIEKAAADRVAAERAERAAAAKALADKRAADRKAAADKKALAEKKAAAEQKAEEAREAAAQKKLERANPERIWVQVAGGAFEGDLPKAWAAAKAKGGDAFAGHASGWTTPLRATNRVLAGPFKTDAEARTFVNKLKGEGMSSFTFTSEAGQIVTKLPAK